MAQKLFNTIKMLYEGHLEYISYPYNSKYEEIVAIAIERFEIPTNLKDLIQITDQSDDIFEKDTFENYILYFPNPQIIFNIEIPDSGLLDDENSGVTVMRQNSFIGSLCEVETSLEEHEAVNNSLHLKRTQSESRKPFSVLYCNEVQSVQVTSQKSFIGSLPKNDSPSMDLAVNVNKKRPNSDDIEAMPVKRENCFIDSCPGNDSVLEQPKCKKQRMNFVKSSLAKKTCCSKSFRV